jgi:hypothetical protein
MDGRIGVGVEKQRQVIKFLSELADLSSCRIWTRATLRLVYFTSLWPVGHCGQTRLYSIMGLLARDLYASHCALCWVRY